MIIQATSDLHGNLIDIPPCDLLLIAGDICPVQDHSIAAQSKFLDTRFRRWLEQVPARQVVGVCGNHDFIFEQAARLIPQGLRWTYLQDSQTIVEGRKIYGTPWQPWFHDWAFNLHEDELAEKWKLIPDDVEILVFHGPPAGYGDRTVVGDHTGSTSQLSRIKQIMPSLVIFGHIHEGHGQWLLQSNGRTTILANVAALDERYNVVNPPNAFEI